MDDTGKYFENLWKNMLNGFARCQMIFDKDGKPVDWIYLLINPAFERLTGLKNVTGKKVTELIPDIRETNPELFEIYSRVATSGKPEVFEVEIKQLSRWFKVSVYSVDSGYFTAVFDNITEHKQHELNIQNTNVELQKFKLAVDFASEHIIITDSEAKILYANSAASRITGYSTDEMIGQNPRLWGGNMGKEFYKGMWKVIKTDKKPFHSQVNNKRKNGQPYTADVTISPVLNPQGEVVYFVGVERDITHEKEVDKMKSEFVSLASHQLRTPLTAIKWFLEMILAGDVGKVTDEQKKFLQQVYESNQRMIELVNSLLNVTRIESGRIIVEPVPTNMASLLNEVVSKLKPQMAEKDIQLILNLQDNLPIVPVDAKLVSAVYEVLLGNSIKYSPKQGKIVVEVSVQGESLVSKVADNGMGIPKEEQEKIFQKFYRATNAVKEHGEGTGLGLYLAKAIIESSGGKIWFESEPGKGTTFWFSLPLVGMKPKKGEVSLS